MRKLGCCGNRKLPKPRFERIVLCEHFQIRRSLAHTRRVVDGTLVVQQGVALFALLCERVCKVVADLRAARAAVHCGAVTLLRPRVVARIVGVVADHKMLERGLRRGLGNRNGNGEQSKNDSDKSFHLSICVSKFFRRAKRASRRANVCRALKCPFRRTKLRPRRRKTA